MRRMEMGLVGLIVLGIFGGAMTLAAEPELFAVLPECVATPDGMAVADDGTLVVACPNYGDPSKPGCLVRVTPDGRTAHWVDLPILEETGLCCPMGIAFAPNGDLWVCDNQDWAGGNGENGEINHGRLLRLTIRGDKIVKSVVVASGISHPNGVRIRDRAAYITVSCLPKVKRDDGLLTSAVYRFPLDAEGIELTNTLEDPNLLVSFVTQNLDCQYGVDGIVFDDAGNLYLGNFGDGTIHRVVFDADRNVVRTEVFAKCDPIPTLNGEDGEPDPEFLSKAIRVPMRTTDGICRADDGTFYIADFSNNAIAAVDADGKNIRFIAMSPDSDGTNGELNQPGEPCVWNGRLMVTCFDMVTGPDKVNTKHDERATIVAIPLAEKKYSPFN